MKKEPQRKLQVVGAEAQSPSDDMALRKVARAVLAIAARQLREESAMSVENGTDTGTEEER